MPLTSFAHDGLTFDVTDTGPGPGPETGIPVVLLHGFPADRRCWEGVSARLAAAGLRTLAPDQRGYSPGARPTQGYPAAYAMDRLVGDVLALLDAAQAPQAHLVGHDWGGAVAWAVAGAHPERLVSVTSLSTPHPAALARAYLVPWQVAHSAYVAFFQLPRLPEVLLGRGLTLGLRRSGLPAAVADRYAARMAEPGALTAALGWYRALRHSHGAVHRVRVPTTYVWGRHDPFLGRRAAEGTQVFVKTDYRFIELDEGHWLPELAPQACAEAVLDRAAYPRCIAAEREAHP